MPRHDPVRESLQRLQAEGYAVERLRRWRRRPRPNFRRPFGFMDLLALKPGVPPLAVHVAAGPWIEVEERTERAALRLAELPAAAAWLAAGLELEVWAWTKDSCTWELRRRAVREKGQTRFRAA